MAETIKFRALEPSDFDEIQRFFYSHTEDTIIGRYDYFKREMPYCEAVKKVTVDFTQNGAIGAFSDDGRKLIGIARLTKDDKKEDHADIAFVIDEQYQDRGIGTYMCSELCTLASAQGYNEVYGHVRYENRRMRHIFERAGFSTQDDKEFDGWKMTLPIQPQSLDALLEEKERIRQENYAADKDTSESNGSTLYEPLINFMFAPVGITLKHAQRIHDWQSTVLGHLSNATQAFIQGPQKNEDAAYERRSA